MITQAMKEYCDDVRQADFPDDKKYCYGMIEGEEEKFIEMMKNEN